MCVVQVKTCKKTCTLPNYVSQLLKNKLKTIISNLIALCNLNSQNNFATKKVSSHLFPLLRYDIQVHLRNLWRTLLKPGKLKHRIT